MKSDVEDDKLLCIFVGQVEEVAHEPPEQELLDTANQSVNDKLRAMWMLVLVMIVIFVGLQRDYKSATTSLTVPSFFNFKHQRAYRRKTVRTTTVIKS